MFRRYSYPKKRFCTNEEIVNLSKFTAIKRKGRNITFHMEDELFPKTVTFTTEFDAAREMDNIMKILTAKNDTS